MQSESKSGIIPKVYKGVTDRTSPLDQRYTIGVTGQVTMEQNYLFKKQEMEMSFVNRKGLVTDRFFT